LNDGQNPKLSRRTCSPRYGLQSWGGKSAGVAKRPRELISHPKSLPLRFATFASLYGPRGYSRTTGRERMGSPTSHALQYPILRTPWLCFRGGGSHTPGSRVRLTPWVAGGGAGAGSRRGEHGGQGPQRGGELLLLRGTRRGGGGGGQQDGGGAAAHHGEFNSPQAIPARTRALRWYQAHAGRGGSSRTSRHTSRRA
jgi:hypothetical protein